MATSAASKGAKGKGPRVAVLVASGASGGHLFPAIAVAQALRTGPSAMDVTFVLGGRKFSDKVEQEGIPLIRLPAAGFSGRGPLGLVWAGLKLAQGVGKAFALVRRTRPAVVFGTGGYASVALVLAARLCGVRTIIHEQNVLPGRANRFLSKLADVVLLTFPESRRYFPHAASKLVVTGTPLRPAILAAATQPHPRPQRGTFTLLVLGGSQGARILSDVVPETLSLLSPTERATLRVLHQARAEDISAVQAAYAALGLKEVTVESFFVDMPALYQQADLLVGRSGVGTVLEAAAFGLPAIYVPLELADGHQKLNAGVAEAAGAAIVVEQAYFTPANLLVHIQALRTSPARCEAMATAARGMANLEATRRVVEVIRKEARTPARCF